MEFCSVQSLHWNQSWGIFLIHILLEMLQWPIWWFSLKKTLLDPHLLRYIYRKLLSSTYCLTIGRLTSFNMLIHITMYWHFLKVHRPLLYMVVTHDSKISLSNAVFLLLHMEMDHTFLFSPLLKSSVRNSSSSLK